MASKNQKNVSLLGLFAFVAIIIKAVSYILSYFNLGLGSLTFIADVTLTVVALVVAWNFAKTCSKNWRIVYFVILALVIAGFVFGGLSL